MTIVANPRQYKIPDWFLNRQKDHKTGRFTQVGGSGGMRESRCEATYRCLERPMSPLATYVNYSNLCFPSVPQLTSAAIDTHMRDDLERLKKIRNHRGLRTYWGLRVRGQHTKTTGRRGRTQPAGKK